MLHNQLLVWVNKPCVQVGERTLDIKCEHELYVQDECPTPVLEAIKAGYTFVAHNAESFDSMAWHHLVDAPNPSWMDTIHYARAGGYPASLEKLSQTLFGRGKLDSGSAKMLYVAKYIHGTLRYCIGTSALWEDMLRYNIMDVLLLRDVYHRLHEYAEFDILNVHSKINSRGFLVDLEYVHQLSECFTLSKILAREEASKLTQGNLTDEEITSPTKVKKWLSTQGLHTETLNRSAIEAMLSDPDGYFGDDESPDVVRVKGFLLARQSASRASGAKIQNLPAIVDDDSRVRNVLTYYGAGPGRWSGRGFQPHNMPRGSKIDIEAITSAPVTLERISELKPSDVSLDDALVTLIRPAIVAGHGRQLIIIDYANVEVRGVAWLAGQYDALQTLFDPASDVYCNLASQLFGRTITKANVAERFIGKTIVLGCGYGMGSVKFGVYCKLNNIDLESVGVTPEQCIKTYRATHPAIVRFWRDLDKACHRVIKSHQTESVGYIEVGYSGTTLTLRLPSGRKIYYRGCTIEKRIPVYNATLPPQDTIVYDSNRGFRKIIYGGLLVENVTQGLCRDLLCHALVVADAANLPICLHVHDEIVYESSDPEVLEMLQKASEIMSSPPVWSNGFPLRVEGFTSPRYVKSPYKGAHKSDYMNGVSVHG